jgi:hypothetical protein
MNPQGRSELGGGSWTPPEARPPWWMADDYLDGYIGWREEAAAARRAYQIWNRAERWDRQLAFTAYRAALDREERAAFTLRERVERLQRWMATIR